MHDIRRSVKSLLKIAPGVFAAILFFVSVASGVLPERSGGILVINGGLPIDKNDDDWTFYSLNSNLTKKLKRKMK